MGYGGELVRGEMRGRDMGKAGGRGRVAGSGGTTRLVALSAAATTAICAAAAAAGRGEERLIYQSDLRGRSGLPKGLA